MHDLFQNPLSLWPHGPIAISKDPSACQPSSKELHTKPLDLMRYNSTLKLHSKRSEEHGAVFQRNLEERRHRGPWNCRVLSGYRQQTASRRVNAFCVKNALGLIKKLGLVDATGQLGHFLASKIVAGGGRGHGEREKVSQKARLTEQTGSVRRKQQCYSKIRNIASMWVTKIAALERKRGPSPTSLLCVD